MRLYPSRKPVSFTYIIDSQPVRWTDLVNYLGIHINDKLQWSSQCQFAASKATRVLNVLRHTMLGCDSEAKYRAYKAIVRPLLEYTCVVWSPHSVKDVNLVEAVQRRAARWVCGSRWNQTTHSWSILMMCAIEIVYTILICQAGLFVSVCSSRHSSWWFY